MVPEQMYAVYERSYIVQICRKRPCVDSLDLVGIHLDLPTRFKPQPPEMVLYAPQHIHCITVSLMCSSTLASQCVTKV
jgi:hypothetical protein